MAIEPPRQCQLNRFSVFNELVELQSALGLSSRVDRISIEIAKTDFDSSGSRLSEIPVALDYEGQVSRDADLNSYSPLGSSNSISLVVSGTPVDFEIDQQIRRHQHQLDSIELERVLKARDANVQRTLVQVIEATQILEILDLRRQVLEDRLSYYTRRKSLGDTVQTQVAEYTTRLREVSERERSTRTRRLTLASSIELMPETMESLPVWDLDVTSFQPVYCDFSSFDTISTETERVLSSFLLQQAERDRSFELASEISVSQTRANQREQLDSSVAFTVSYPLYAGNRLNNAEQSAIQQLELTKFRLTQLKSLDQERSIRQRSVEEIYYQSMITQLRQIQGIREKIAELTQRKAMGQSVYEELSDNLLEELNTRESLTRLQSEALLAWIDFLAARYER